MELLDKIRIVFLAILVFLFAADMLDISLDFIPGMVKSIVFGLLIVFYIIFRTQRIGSVGKTLYTVFESSDEQKEEKDETVDRFSEILHTKCKPRN